ncbi:MAG: DUF6465 family protein [Lachnospiraceae bacterium]
MAIAKKEPEKVTETKTAKVETPKAEVKKTDVVKTEPAKKTTAARTAVSKTTPVKTTAAKKSTAAKKPEPKTSVVVEFAGKQIDSKDVVAAAKKAFTKANKGVAIKTLEVYVKPEEHVAYYVVNGQGSDDYKITL